VQAVGDRVQAGHAELLTWCELLPKFSEALEKAMGENNKRMACFTVSVEATEASKEELHNVKLAFVKSGNDYEARIKIYEARIATSEARIATLETATDTLEAEKAKVKDAILNTIAFVPACLQMRSDKAGALLLARTLRRMCPGSMTESEYTEACELIDDMAEPTPAPPPPLAPPPPPGV
jgi:chromosome segregation ATPase